MAKYSSVDCFPSDFEVIGKSDCYPFDFRYDHLGSADFDGFLDAVPLRSYIFSDPLYASLDIQQHSPTIDIIPVERKEVCVWDELGCLFEPEREKIRPKEEEEEDTKEVKVLREEKGISKGLTKEAISKYFYMPITQAAKELNVGLTLLKKRCRELGIKRWPHRKLMSLQTLMKNVQEMKKVESEESEGKLKEAIKLLEREKRHVEEEPDMQLEHKTKRLRQACFKANYKKRKSMGIVNYNNPNSSSSSSSITCSDPIVAVGRGRNEEEEDDDEEIRSLLNDPLSYKNTLLF